LTSTAVSDEMKITIETVTMEDYDDILQLWKEAQGVGLSASDERRSFASYLARNPGFSLVARDGEQIVGVILCGHDGRRGYIHHLAVSHSHRRRGIGRRLVRRCTSLLKADGIQKCHLFVFRANQEARSFWESVGWHHREDLTMMSRETDDG
jgi:ribosomal protein S18 acetylase RimI-like enzyme